MAKKKKAAEEVLEVPEVVEEEVVVIVEEEAPEPKVKKPCLEEITLHGHELKGHTKGKVFHSIDGCTYDLA